jgi:predicted MFS family arabinose efflux permease
LALTFVFMAAFYSTYGIIGTHLVQELGTSVSLTGILALSYGFGFAAASFADPMLDRFGARRLLVPSFGFIAAVYHVLQGVSCSAPAIIAIACVWGLANHFGLNLLVAGLSHRQPNQRGAVLGAYSAVTYLAAGAATFSAAKAYPTLGFAGVALGASLLVAVATLLTYLVSRRHYPQAEI